MRLRTINHLPETEEIIRKCQWCHLAMCSPDGEPYVLPMNFGYRDGVIYLHGAQQGKKIDLLKQNPRVCINFATDQQLRYQSEHVACSWNMSYRSVLCYGRVEFIDDPESKIAALDVIMSQYSERQFQYNPPSIREVCVFTVKVERIEGRAFGR